MTPEQATALRAPFPESAIGKLPRVTCKNCTEANKRQWGATCDKHTKHNCAVCGNWISEKHIHLDYIGHAGVTDRLLQVDPEWTWDFYGTGSIEQRGNDSVLWISLTVCGVTRIGVGIVATKSFELEKQLISDAIRNAAMRFGVGLDLWSKEDLGHDTENAGEGQPSDKSAVSDGIPTAPPSPATSPARRQALKAAAIALEANGKDVKGAVVLWQLPKIDDCDEKQLGLYEELIHDLEKNLFDVAGAI